MLEKTRPEVYEQQVQQLKLFFPKCLPNVQCTVLRTLLNYAVDVSVLRT